MQIWPRQSAAQQLTHHVLHAYAFWPSQTKMWLFPDFSQPSGYLTEGLNTYYEQVVPAELLGDDASLGRLYLFLALDQRGSRFDIRASQQHQTYNVSTLKVYLLDQYIRRVTGDTRNLDDFTRVLWDTVKDNTEPHTLTAGETAAAFATVVGRANQGYLTELVGQDTFDREAFASLEQPFRAHVKWMSDDYFWGKPALFCAFLDIAAAKGQEWPHFVNCPHNIPGYRGAALQPFKEYLAGLGREDFSEEDIIAALSSVTGKDHSGFFEFWNGFGLPITPADFAPLSSWDPNRATEGDLVNVYQPVGSLWTEHYLSGISQRAEIVLDQPAPAATIGLQVTLGRFDGFPTDAEAKAVAGSQNVSFLSSRSSQDRGVYYTLAFFRMTTDDPERMTFSFDLTLPSPETHPRFGAFRIGQNGQDAPLGEIYAPQPIAPVQFSADIRAGQVTLPDTEIEEATYRVSFGDQAVEAKPGETVSLGRQADAVRVELIDRYGFVRGVVSGLPKAAGWSGGTIALLLCLAACGVAAAVWLARRALWPLRKPDAHDP